MTSKSSKPHEEYIATDPIAVLQAHYALSDMGKSEKISAILLDGPPGVGKTFLGKHLARLLGAKLLHFQVFPGCDRSDMIWDNTYSSGAGGQNEGILIQAIRLSEKTPVMLILDELDKSDIRVDSFLLNFLNEGFLLIPQLGLLRANTANLFVVITKNDNRDASAPLLRRCRVVYMEWPTVEIESKIIMKAAPAMTYEACERILEIPNRLRINPTTIKAPSTNELMRLAPDLLDLINRGAENKLLGEYYINAIVQNNKDRRLVEKTPVYVGLYLREKLESCAKNHPPGDSTVLDDVVAHFIHER